MRNEEGNCTWNILSCREKCSLWFLLLVWRILPSRDGRKCPTSGTRPAPLRNGPDFARPALGQIGLWHEPFVGQVGHGPLGCPTPRHSLLYDFVFVFVFFFILLYIIFYFPSNLSPKVSKFILLALNLFWIKKICIYIEEYDVLILMLLWWKFILFFKFKEIWA